MHKAFRIHQRHSILRSSYLFFLAICLIGLISACGSSTTTGSTTSSSGGSTPTAATCNKSTGLTVYSAQGYDSDATKAFQQQTGITTKLVDDSTGNLLAKISAEGNNP